MATVLGGSSELRHESLHISVQGVSIIVAIARRDEPLAPILFLRGFGGSKEDYLDVVLHPSFNNRAFVPFDAPGCGKTTVADAVLDALNVKRFHLLGHSMGGLAGLELATLHPGAILSFVNIKGNLAPEDCFLSGQIFTWADEDSEEFLANFIERNYLSPLFSAPLYASNVRSKVRADAVRGIFESMVHLSDEGGLLAKFLSLPFPRMFMYGEQYRTLSYLSTLGERGVCLAEIPYCGHFPMYSNPVAMWNSLSQFLADSEQS
ncbi:alpha/beta-hydrolase [Thozetella sp. PMI_491]|nr:alpha/beta-hydrolase [Thozetella sp. PMI_491]